MTAPISHQAYIRAMNRITRDNETLHRSEDHTYERLECDPMRTIDDFENDKTPLRDLLQHNPDDWDNFLNGHLGAYIDFQNWLKDQYFNKKDEALVRIVDRAIEELES